MRYDLAFFLCCCKSFLGSTEEEDDYYQLLGVERDASPEELKRGYKRQSLKMHPDKLAQRGLKVTPESQAQFTKMKEAFETLSDPHKRETYDAVGVKGMKWMEEPFSIDPSELASNFARSSVVDRSKIFGIFVAIAIAFLILPVLICLHVDGVFGEDASWLATLTPLWLWDAFLLFYHSRVILMGPIPRPDHIPESEWVDPLPMKKRIFSLVRFTLIVIFQILVALKLDHFVSVPWSVIFVPLYIWEATTLYKKWPLAKMRIVTVEDLEAALGKPFSEFTQTEKELIGQRYSVVSSTNSPDFDVAQKLKSRARQDILKSLVRIAFGVVLLVHLDGGYDWSWWLVFTPFWIMTVLLCYSNYQAFAEVQKRAAEKDPTLFAPPNQEQQQSAQEGGKYGAVGEDGVATPAASAQSPLTEEEREELKAQVMASSSKLCSKCCSQGFLLIVVFLFVAKLQGAGFSSFLIIAPFLAIAGVVLCCIGCAVYGVTEVSTEGIDFATSDFAYHNAEAGNAPGPAGAPAANNSAPSQPAYVPPPAAETQQQSAPAVPAPVPVAATPQPDHAATDMAEATSAVDTPEVTNDEKRQTDEPVGCLDDAAAATKHVNVPVEKQSKDVTDDELD